MSVQRIHHPKSRTVGWQARAYVAKGHRLTRFFADGSHGGMAEAYEVAAKAERQLERRARSLRRAAR